MRSLLAVVVSCSSRVSNPRSGLGAGHRRAAVPSLPVTRRPILLPIALAKRTIDAQGGAAWAKARFLSFTFVVERNGQATASFPQQWDRVTGDYRVSGVDPKGVPFTVVLNTKTRTGRAWLRAWRSPICRR